MRKILLIIILLLIITLVGAQVLIPNNRRIAISEDAENILKQTNNIDSLSISLGNTVCKDDYCITKIYQEGLIDTFYKQPRYINKTSGREYTAQQMRAKLDEYIKLKIEDYAQVQQNRTNALSVVDNGGTLTR